MPARENWFSGGRPRADRREAVTLSLHAGTDGHTAGDGERTGLGPVATAGTRAGPDGVAAVAHTQSDRAIGGKAGRLSAAHRDIDARRARCDLLPGTPAGGHRQRHIGSGW